MTRSFWAWDPRQWRSSEAHDLPYNTHLLSVPSWWNGDLRGVMSSEGRASELHLSQTPRVQGHSYWYQCRSSDSRGYGYLGLKYSQPMQKRFDWWKNKRRSCRFSGQSPAWVSSIESWSHTWVSSQIQTLNSQKFSRKNPIIIYVAAMISSERVCRNVLNTSYSFPK